MNARRIEDRFLIFLQISIISQRESFKQCQKSDEVAVDPAGLTPDQFRHIRIFLPRHETASGTEGIRQRNKAERLRRPQDQLFTQPGEMHHDYRNRRYKLDREVPVAHGVYAVLSHFGKSKQARQMIPVYRIIRPGNRSGTKR